ncbi:MAG: RnfABCDGE type electron transport complex subunit B [Clostridia bacterium]|nr:RnfABCDGE type electron transport complex subunit B [Clostridia bacterium]
MEYIYPIAVFAVLGLLLGGMLAIAAKLFAIDADPRIEQIADCLPGANCGGCGFAGCSACAAAIVSGEAEVTACPGVSKDNLKKMCEIMGMESVEKEEVCAVVKCQGTFESAVYRYLFDGSKSCSDIMALKDGDKMCTYACLGYGDCQKVCEFGAISMENGIAKIDRDVCIGCGVCAKQCPRSVIAIVPKSAKVQVLCNSKDKGAAMKATCSAGCIGCKMCEKVCPKQAISVTDNLAVIDNTRCTGCGACVEKCPKKIIHLLGEEN